MTQGGPGDSTSTVMSQAVTTAFIQNNVGKGSAMTVCFVVIIILITLIQRRVLREEREIS
jgi:multiple sugar transport system permease protein